MTTADPTTHDIDARSWLRIAIICGFLGCVCYGLAVWVPLPFRVSYLTFFAFGPFMIAAVVAIFHYLRSYHDGIALQLGAVFLVCAGIAVTMMTTMQGMIRGHYHEARAAAETEAEKQEVREHFRAVDTTQQGLDMAFDVFVSTGTFLLAVALVRQPRFGAWFGVPGMAIAAAGLFLNAISFPEVNAGDAGYIDPAPFFVVFYVVLSSKFLWEWIRVEKASSRLAS